MKLLRSDAVFVAGCSASTADVRLMPRTNVELHQEADMVSSPCVVVVIWCDRNYDNAVANPHIYSVEALPM